MVFERGAGTPLVFIPGLQGRWEYTRATVEALARHFRVLTFSLADEPASGFEFDESRAFESYADHVRTVMDAAGVDRAIVCGLSFGGLVALNLASRHPNRVEALVLTSTPGPGFSLRPRHEMYARLPWLFGPVFLVEAPFRAGPEIRRAIPTGRERLAFARAMARAAVTAPLSTPRMANRAKLIASYDIASACARVTARTLVVTGEASLDRVVDVTRTAQYAQMIGGARHAVLERTGHQGTLTRPHAYADIIRRFAGGQHHAAA